MRKTICNWCGKDIEGESRLNLSLSVSSGGCIASHNVLPTSCDMHSHCFDAFIGTLEVFTEKHLLFNGKDNTDVDTN